VRTAKQVLWFALKQEPSNLISLVIYAALAACLSLLPPVVIAILYSTVIPSADISLLIQVVVILAITTISATLFTFFRSLLVLHLEGKASYEIEAAFWDRLLKLPAQFFQQRSSGNLFARIRGLDEIRILLTTNGTRGILSGIFSLFYFLAMAVYSLPLAAIALCIFFFSVTVTLILAWFKIGFEKKAATLRATLNGTLVQIVAAVSKFRICAKETQAFSHWARLFVTKKRVELKASNLASALAIVNGTLPFLSALLIFAVAMHLEKGGHLFAWQFLAFNAAFALFSIALIDLTQTIATLTPIVSLWDNAKEILASPLEAPSSKRYPGTLHGALSIDAVSFYYNQHHPILHNVSFQIAPGEFVGLVGHAGCGKSTLLRLLLHFEKPISGAIYYDDKDLASLNPHDVRKQIGTVLQDTNLIAGTIYDNIVCGGFFSKEDIQRAIFLSGFQEDLMQLPMQLHTLITADGGTLSGGQKQRLLIARALVASPKILIFDEATSFLDNRVQETISTNIGALKMTRLVVAHRLSTLRDADRIYVLDQGHIVQSGAFHALAAQEGVFQRMLAKQLL
jgi:NHLM bacteriocin system ABC transporter ATP-binding protein